MKKEPTGKKSLKFLNTLVSSNEKSFDIPLIQMAYLNIIIILFLSFTFC